MDTHKNSIMTVNGLVLTAMIKSFLIELDNYTQISADAGDDDISFEFSNDYLELEKLYLKSKEIPLSDKEKNFIRLTMKHCVKQAGLYFC